MVGRLSIVLDKVYKYVRFIRRFCYEAKDGICIVYEDYKHKNNAKKDKH